MTEQERREDEPAVRDRSLERLEQTMEEYASLYAELKPLIDQLDQKKKQVAGLAKEMQITHSHAGVKVTYRDGYTRRSVKVDQLIGYAAAHPEVMQFIKESNVRPSASIRVTG